MTNIYSPPMLLLRRVEPKSSLRRGAWDEITKVFLLKHRGEMECRSGEARADCWKSGAEADARARGVRRGIQDRVAG